MFASSFFILSCLGTGFDFRAVPERFSDSAAYASSTAQRSRRAIDLHGHYGGDNRDRVCRRLVFRDLFLFFFSVAFVSRFFFFLPVLPPATVSERPCRSNPVQNWPHQAESGSCGHWQNGCSARLGEFFIFFLYFVNVVIIKYMVYTYGW